MIGNLNLERRYFLTGNYWQIQLWKNLRLTMLLTQTNSFILHCSGSTEGWIEYNSACVLECDKKRSWIRLSNLGHLSDLNCCGATDASIWIIQFMKAMRDDRGDMIRNAHLLGFFRRICKLLFLRIKPVFVFDGGTPALKRRTVIARRRQREQAQSKIRKTAEKLLLNHVSLDPWQGVVDRQFLQLNTWNLWWLSEPLVALVKIWDL